MAAVRRSVGAQPEDAALIQWGPLFQHDRTASPKLDSLLRGIARCISHHFERNEYCDLSPRALAGFYNAVGGNYDQLFLNTSPNSVAFIYKNLKCPHSLQPASSSTYSDPFVPALKPTGFVIWQTIQLMLGPSEHVPFIQNALRYFDVRDPDTNVQFPKYIPSSAFPSAPEPTMIKWHSDVSERLRREAQQASSGNGRPRSSDSMTTDEGTAISADEHHDAAGFFANPLYKNKDGRPDIVTQLSRAPSKVLAGGKSMALNVYQGGKMIVSPHLFGGPSRKKSHSRSPSRDRDEKQRHARHIAASDNRRPSSPLRASSRDKGRRPQRRATPSPTDLAEETDKIERERRRQVRRHRSHESTDSSQTREPDNHPRRRHSVEYKHKPRLSSRSEHRYHDKGPSRSPSQAGKMTQQRPGSQSQSRQDYHNGRAAPGPSNLSGGQTSSQRPGPHRSNSDSRSAHAQRPLLRPDRQDPGDSDSTIGRSSRPRGVTLGHTPENAQNPVPIDPTDRLSLNTQEEWDGLKQSISGSWNPSPNGGAALSSGERERRESVKPDAVGGVKGRRYANVAPWD